MARLAEKAQRYEDMVQYVTRLVQMGAELSPDERCLLSAAFQNTVGARRQAWRAVHILEEKQGNKGPAILELIKGYKSKVEAEMTKRCTDLLSMLDADLVRTASTTEDKVFYLKMKGDYCRYLAEFAVGEGHSRRSSEAHAAYTKASELATAQLRATNPIRLGLALNFSVFFYEVFGSPEKACAIAKSAFDDAMSAMGGMDEDEYKDSAAIMQLLRDNLQLWTSSMAPEYGGGGDGTALEDM